MLRGVYPRKKFAKRTVKIPSDAWRQVSYHQTTAKERTDSKKNLFIQQIISSIQNQLNLLREITNG